MTTIDRLSDIYEKNGINFATGIPCGVLGEFILSFNSDSRILHIPALNEREAVGLAAGAYLGGKMPVLYMQNSGFFVSSNEFASVLALMRIPALAIISHRGCFGEDATQHLLTGRNTKTLLNGFGIFHLEMTEDNMEEVITEAVRHAKKNMMPVAILVKRGWNGHPFVSGQPSGGMNVLRNSSGTIRNLMNNSMDLDREAAIDCVMSVCSGFGIENPNAIISTTGLISRSCYERYDNPCLIYNPGGFGQTSAIGLGFALAKPDVITAIIDGDASVMADIGNLSLVGANKPKNLIHVVIDNEAYGSCSEEKSLSSVIDLPAIASASGYRNVFVVDSAEYLKSALACSLDGNGPLMVIAKVKLGGRRNFSRPLNMSAISERFRNNFAK